MSFKHVAALCVVFLLAGDVVKASPQEAQALVAADLKAQRPSDRPFLKYIWVPSELSTTQWRHAVKLTSLAVNIISRGDVIHRPMLISNQAPIVDLMRVDIRQYGLELSDFEDWLNLWEELRFDPFFATIVTRDTIKQFQEAGVVFPNVIEIGSTRILVKCKPYEANGEKLDSKWVDAIRLPGRHLNHAVDAELFALTGSEAVVVNYQYFCYRALSTIKDTGLYATVFGGLYYDFAGLKKSKDKKFNDEDLLFESIGVGDTKLGLTAEVIYERVKSDRRAAMFRSKVTGKPRIVDFLKSLQGTDSSFAFVTHDVEDADIDIGTHAMMNLAKVKPGSTNNGTDKAREIIFARRNGLHGFALTNGKGVLQESAPDKVVVDSLIPSPHTKRLQGAISCLRCHGVDGSDGIKPVENDVIKLVNNGIDIFGDTTNLDKGIPETLNRLAGQYLARPEKTLRRAREDYIEAILRATGPWKEDKDQTGVGKLAAEGYAEMWEDWWYRGVDAKKALADLGYTNVPKEEAIATFRQLVPPDPYSRVPGFLGLVPPIMPEDPRIGAFRVLDKLRAGITTTRADWSLVFSFAAARAQQTKARLAEKKERP